MVTNYRLQANQLVALSQRRPT